MKRLLISMFLCVTYLAFGGGPTSARKPVKPALDHFEATISPPMGDFSSVSIYIEEYSAPEEVHNLADIFAKGKQDALDIALSKMKKGFFRYGGSMGMQIMLVELNTGPGFRTFNIAGRAFDTVQNETGQRVIIGHRGYPYTCIEIEVDEQGNGKGMLTPIANLVFN